MNGLQLIQAVDAKMQKDSQKDCDWGLIPKKWTIALVVDWDLIYRTVGAVCVYAGGYFLGNTLR